MKYCDLHCDLLDKIDAPAAWTDGREDLHITPAKLCGSVFLQTFAVFAENGRADMAHFRRKAALFRELSARLAPRGTLAVLSVENAAMAEGREENIEQMARAGVKLCGLVWNGGNALGGAHDTGGGLTPVGRRIVETLAACNILVDVSHLSDQGFTDVCNILRLYKKPFVASHSNARELCENTRNLTDLQLRAIAESGGIVGVNFYPLFLGKYSSAKHIAYMIDICGEDTVAIGSDFDGIPRGYYRDCQEAAAKLEEALKGEGLSFRQIEKVLQKNALRVLGF